MRKFKFARGTGALFLLAALGAVVHADGTMTRAQVKAELAEAIRTGDMLANDESGLRLNEERPQRYAKARANGDPSRTVAAEAPWASGGATQ